MALDYLDQSTRSSWWDSKKLDEIFQYSRLAGLLHDIGQAPFSYIFEDTARKLNDMKMIKGEYDQRKMSQRIIIEKESELGLGEPFEAGELNEILDMRGSAPDFLNELIYGPWSCDILDFLMREYKNLDTKEIIRGFRVKHLELLISSTALPAIVNIFGSFRSTYTSIYSDRTSQAFDLMIADALFMIPEFIEEIISSVDEFLKYDDTSLVYDIRERSRGENRWRRPYKEAYEILNKVRNRQKTYKCIFESPINLSILFKKDLKLNIQEFCERIENVCREYCDAESLNIRFEYRPAIRPANDILEYLLKWILCPRIYDIRTQEAKPLREISRTYFREIAHYSVQFRIFANYLEIEKNPHVLNRIREIAEEELEVHFTE